MYIITVNNVFNNFLSSILITNYIEIKHYLEKLINVLFWDFIVKKFYMVFHWKFSMVRNAECESMACELFVALITQMPSAFDWYMLRGSYGIYSHLGIWFTQIASLCNKLTTSMNVEWYRSFYWEKLWNLISIHFQVPTKPMPFHTPYKLWTLKNIYLT